MKSDVQMHQKSDREPYSIKIVGVIALPNGGQFPLPIFTELVNNANERLTYWELSFSYIKSTMIV